MVSVALIGAGVIGLSTAVRIQNILPRVQVTVFADRFYKDTTSHGAAGFFRPTLELMPGVDPVTALKWVKDSWQHFDKIVKSEDAKEAGMSVLSGFHVFDGDTMYQAKPNLMAESIYCFRPMTEREHAILPKRYDNGYFITTIMIESTWYLHYLMKRFKDNGGKLIEKTVTNVKEFCGKYDVLVNCSGLESRKLFHDTEIVPIRGQMLRVKAPWMKHFYMIGSMTWVVPGIETVVVGGTRQVGSDDISVNEQDKEEVWERACQILPHLRKAEFQWVWTGLRPHRKPVRVEAEILNLDGQKLKVVHNYGHGGNGVSLSWGTACAAADLVKLQLQSTHSKL